MNNKGQALVEFIIIMPILIMLLLAFFDFVNVIQKKMELERIIEEVTLESNYSLSSDMSLEKVSLDNMVTYKLSSDVEMTSPLVSVLIDNYHVTVERTIYAK
ncbi:MAG: hypothetical protein E7164_03165 [Firmicutes bacterium]|nr:hypothetical protein [Bacillota bacterium]